jgi:hypothetical protein
MPAHEMIRDAMMNMIDAEVHRNPVDNFFEISLLD